MEMAMAMAMEMEMCSFDTHRYEKSIRKTKRGKKEGRNGKKMVSGTFWKRKNSRENKR